MWIIKKYSLLLQWHVLITPYSSSVLDSSVGLFYWAHAVFSNIKKSPTWYIKPSVNIILEVKPNSQINICWILFISTRFYIKSVCTYSLLFNIQKPKLSPHLDLWNHYTWSSSEKSIFKSLQPHIIFLAGKEQSSRIKQIYYTHSNPIFGFQVIPVIV